MTVVDLWFLNSVYQIIWPKSFTLFIITISAKTGVAHCADKLKTRLVGIGHDPQLIRSVQHARSVLHILNIS